MQDKANPPPTLQACHYGLWGGVGVAFVRLLLCKDSCEAEISFIVMMEPKFTSKCPETEEFLNKQLRT